MSKKRMERCARWADSGTNSKNGGSMAKEKKTILIKRI